MEMYKPKLLILFAIALLTSCVSKSKFASLEADRNLLKKELHVTKKGVFELEEEKNQLLVSKKQLDKEVASMRNQLRETESEIESLNLVLNTIGQLSEGSEEVDPNLIDEEPYKPKATFTTFKPDYYKSEKSINFNSGSTAVPSEDKSYLKEIAQQFLQNPSVHYVIEGHADHRPLKSTARYRDNWDLSTKRGEAVAKVLVEMGVNPAQFTVTGKSDTKPMVSGFELSDEDLAKNRRVEIFAQSDIQEPGNDVNSITVSPAI